MNKLKVKNPKTGTIGHVNLKQNFRQKRGELAAKAKARVLSMGGILLGVRQK